MKKILILVITLSLFWIYNVYSQYTSKCQIAKESIADMVYNLYLLQSNNDRWYIKDLWLLIDKKDISYNIRESIKDYKQFNCIKKYSVWQP